MVQELQQTNAVVEIPVEMISPNPHQPRKNFDLTALRELADSIQEHGIQQAIVVRVLDREAGTYELVMGERRLRACKLLEMATIPAVIREEMTDETSQELALIENLQRDDLTPIEEAKSLAELAERYDNDLKQVAERVSKSEIYIGDRIALLGLPEEVQTQIDHGQINLAQAKVILELEAAVQIEAANRVIKLNLTANELRGRMQRFLKKDQDGSGRGPSKSGGVTYNQLTTILVRLYDGLDSYDFSILGDQNKRTTLKKQMTLIQRALDSALNQLEFNQGSGEESGESQETGEEPSQEFAGQNA